MSDDKARIANLEWQLAEVDEMLTKNAYLIGKNPPDITGSILAAAMRRHFTRLARAKSAEG